MVLLTAENKRVVVNTSTDVCLFDAPHNPANTGTRYTSGTDYYAHTARSGKIYFYSYSWSMWQGTIDEYELVEPDEMRQILLVKSGKAGWDGLRDSEKEKAERYFPGIFDEDA